MAYITSIRLVDFRSYKALDIELEAGPIAIFGSNGAGKTNLLEALSILSPGRGLRRAGVDLFAHLGNESGIRAKAWGINAQLDNDSRISVGQVPEHPKRRIIKIDGKAATGSQLAALLAIMWLTPAQDRLFTGPASDRRKFIDRFALTHHPQHGHNSLRYEKARAQRNRLLSDGVQDPAWYDALELDLSNYGADILRIRFETIGHLQKAINARESIFPKSQLRLDGPAENLWHQEDDKDFDGFINRLREEYAATRHQDMRAGRTLLGPHRSDLSVTHIDKSMPAALCSTGEQKALLIGLILAQARAQSDKAPILLLDEVTAHLDPPRRKELAQELIDLKLQVFMTGTEIQLFKDFDRTAQMIEIKDNQAIWHHSLS